MSKIITMCKTMDLGHIVQTNDDFYYYIDSKETSDDGYETMVFKAKNNTEKFNDVEDFNVIDWKSRYTEYYNNYSQMKERHNYLIEHLEEVL